MLFQSSYKMQQLAKKGNFLLWASCALCILFFVCFFLFDDHHEAIVTKTGISKEAREEKDYSLIGKGGFVLRSEQHGASFSHLQKEIRVLGRLSRPGKLDPSNKILVSLKSSGQKMIVAEGERVYISPTGIAENLCFSPVPTLLVMSLREEKDGVRFFLEYDKAQKSQFFLKVEDNFPKEILDSQPFVEIRAAKCWGPDKLFQEYGGSSYEKEKNHYQIQFVEDQQSYVLSIKMGDYLMWDGKVWKKVGFSEISPRRPLAVVKNVSMSGVEMDVWDVSGFYCLHVQNPLNFLPKSQTKIEEVFTSLRLKTNSQVSCLVSKKRVVLKKGDWWIGSKNGWRSIKSLEEIDQLLHHQIRGELFIFDSVEKNQGKTYIKGHLFDEMRTTMQPVTLQISEKKVAVKPPKPQSKGMSSHPGMPMQGEERPPFPMEDDGWEKSQ